MKYIAPVALLVAALFSLGIAGCTTDSADPTGSNTPAAGDHDHSQHAQQDAPGQTDMEKMKAELANLSPDDATSAEKQHICPVTQAMLGTMGAPQKVDVSGQQVWICCAGCKDELLANSDVYLAKLKP